MSAKIYFLDLKDDPKLIAQYEDWHEPGRVPSAVIHSIRESGITDMQIFRTGNRLVMVVESDPQFDSKRTAAGVEPAVIAWESLMDRFQQRLPWAEPGQKWVPAQRIFSLQDQE